MRADHACVDTWLAGCPRVRIETGNLLEFVLAIEESVVEPKRKAPDRPVDDGGGIREVPNPMLATRNLQDGTKISRLPERRTD